MNKEDIIRMAWKAGFERLGHTNNDWVCYPDDIERFATLVASAEREASVGALSALNDTYELELRKAIATEREACAKVCEDAPEPDGADLAERIRARGQA